MKNILKVLIVEDDIISALLLFAYLKLLGNCECSMVTTGEDAVSAAEDYMPDIVLSEINLAGKLNGIEAAKKIINKNRDAKVAFLTSCDEREIMEDAQKLSPAAYFIKPIKIEKVKEILNSINRENQPSEALYNEPCGILNGVNYENE